MGYTIRKNKHTLKYDVYLSGYVGMYCWTCDTKEECREHIIKQKKWEKEMYKI